jgi:sec-independent protein translocase protein TatC
MATNSNHSDDDIFKDSRMSFGDHIEELRTRLFLAIKGLAFCLVIGFVLDFVGVYLGYDNFGIGRPVMKMIVSPVKEAVRDFYHAKLQKLFVKLPQVASDPDEVERIRAKLSKNENRIDCLTRQERETLVAAPRPLPITLPIEPLREALGLELKNGPKEITVEAKIFPAHLNLYNLEGEVLLNSKDYLTTLSAQESLVVYFKVSLLCGVVMGSPWIFYQIWMFISAGLYPHERAYVHRYLPLAIVLFLAGVFLCQFFVMPAAVRALLSFNNWIDAEPDLRLNEWLGFALILPLVFGVSFQTPMVMFLLTRLGLFSWEIYLAKWKYAVMFLAVFAAFITPTPDIITMLYLFVPLFGLYMFGIALCWMYPPSHELLEDDDSEVAV